MPFGSAQAIRSTQGLLFFALGWSGKPVATWQTGSGTIPGLQSRATFGMRLAPA